MKSNARKATRGMKFKEWAIDKAIADKTLVFKNVDARIFLPSIKNNSVDLILTDPPYLISKDTGFASIGKKGIERFKVSMDFGKWDRVTNEEHTALLNTVFRECYRALKDSGTIIVFYDLWKIESLMQMLKAIGFGMFRFIEWVKTNPVPLNSKAIYLSNAREIAIVAVKGGKPTFKTEYHNGIFSMPIHRDGGKRLHPTQKPLALMKELIEIHTNEGAIVLDPFAGVGTTALASLQLSRIAWASEIDKSYFDKATKRIGELM